MKKMLILSLTVVTFAAIIGCVACTSGTVPSRISPVVPEGDKISGPGMNQHPPENIYFNEVPDIISRFGSSVEIKLTFTNHDSVERIMSEFPPRITLEARNLPFSNRIIRVFPAGQEQLHLQPGESKEYVLNWDQKDDNGQEASYGWYSIRMMVNSREVTDTQSRQGAGGQVTRVLVLPRGGVMEKNIEVNQSQTADGVTINLEKMELQNQGARLYTFTFPEGYVPQGAPALYGTYAEYRVDDEDWKPAFRAEFGTFLLEEGIRHIWDLDPVPLNSRELSFRFKQIGDRQGPWEFKIKLY